MSEHVSPKNVAQNSEAPLSRMSAWLDNVIRAAEHFIALGSKIKSFFESEDELTLEKILLAAPPGSDGNPIEATGGFGHELFRTIQIPQGDYQHHDVVRTYPALFAGKQFESILSTSNETSIYVTHESSKENNLQVDNRSALTMLPLAPAPLAPIKPVFPHFPIPVEPTEDSMKLLNNSSLPNKEQMEMTIRHFTFQNEGESAQTDIAQQIQIIENAIYHEQDFISTLRINACYLSEEITTIEAHLLTDITTVQNTFTDLQNDHLVIRPILTPFITKTILGSVVGGIEYVLNKIQFANLFKIDLQSDLGDIVNLKNTLEQYEHSGVEINHKAQKLAIDAAAKMVEKPVENYTQAQNIFAENQHTMQDSKHATPDYQDLEKNINTANQISDFFGKVHLLYTHCHYLTEEFENMNAGRGMLRDIQAQIEGRSENIVRLEAQHQQLTKLLPLEELEIRELNVDTNSVDLIQLLEKSNVSNQSQLTCDDVFSNESQLTYIDLSANANTQQTNYSHGQTTLEIPGFCAQQQLPLETPHFN